MRRLAGQRAGVSVKPIGRRTNTRTARPCARPGRNTAPSTNARAASSKPACELWSTREAGSARPTVSITTCTTTVPTVPVRRSTSGYTSAGPASSTGPGIGSNRLTGDASSDGSGHEMTMGGPAAPDTRCGRSVASTAAAHTPACTSTAIVLLGTGGRAAMGFLDAMSRSNMEIPHRERSPSACHASLAAGWLERDELMTAALGLRRRRLAWQRDGERRPPPRAAHDIDAPAVRLGDPLADGEAQPGAGALTGARACRVGAPEAIEDVREIPRRDADPRVGDAEGDPAVRGAQLHAHCPARGSVLHGVGQEVQDQLADARRVDRDDDRLGRRRDLYPHPRLLGEQLAGLADLFDDPPQVHGLAVQ